MKQIVISVPDEWLEGTQPNLYDVMGAVMNGTVLPEPHGRLADLDAALKCVEEVTDSKEKEYAIALFDWAMSKRVIIPATKGENNADSD